MHHHVGLVSITWNENFPLEEQTLETTRKRNSKRQSGSLYLLIRSMKFDKSVGKMAFPIFLMSRYPNKHHAHTFI
jgi:hypothetical protein